YVPGYGPEIWNVQYRVRQQNLGNDYWETRPLRPAYDQLYPPEKGQPRTFMEVRYPAMQPDPTLLSQLQRHDAEFDRIAKASVDVTQAMTLVAGGESQKAHEAGVETYLRGAVSLTAQGK